jgi:forespore regulator of the sigma-K checkpoint
VDIGRLWNKVRRRLRQNRRWLSLGAWVLVIVGGAVLYALFDDTLSSRDQESTLKDSKSIPVQSTPVALDAGASLQHRQETLNRIRSSGGKREVFLQSNYVCGEEVTRLGENQADEIIALSERNADWTVAIHQDGPVYFIRNINDLSPECKEQAYFGIDKNGNLSLFEGLPKDEKVLRTFFQLNIEYLETSLPRETVEQLREGIRITDLAEYNSVLSTFSEFALELADSSVKP